MWVCFYGDGDQQIRKETISRITQLLNDDFTLGRARGAIGTNERTVAVADLCRWIEEAQDAQHRELPRRLPYWVWGPQGGAGSPAWSISCDNRLQYKYDAPNRAGDPRVVLHVDFATSKEAGALRLSVQKLVDAILNDDSIWYGFIDPVNAEAVRSSAVYLGDWPENAGCWERYVEMSYWQDHALRDRDRVRGVFWGNMFGPKFAQRVRNADLELQLQRLYEEWMHQPVVIANVGTGSMAILLDDNPLSFARFRDVGLERGSLSGAIHSGGMLKEVLSRARLL